MSAPTDVIMGTVAATPAQPPQQPSVSAPTPLNAPLNALPAAVSTHNTPAYTGLTAASPLSTLAVSSAAPSALPPMHFAIPPIGGLSSLAEGETRDQKTIGEAEQISQRAVLSARHLLAEEGTLTDRDFGFVDLGAAAPAEDGDDFGLDTDRPDSPRLHANAASMSGATVASAVAVAVAGTPSVAISAADANTATASAMPTIIPAVKMADATPSSKSAASAAEAAAEVNIQKTQAMLDIILKNAYYTNASESEKKVRKAEILTEINRFLRDPKKYPIESPMDILNNLVRYAGNQVLRLAPNLDEGARPATAAAAAAFVPNLNASAATTSAATAATADPFAALSSEDKKAIFGDVDPQLFALQQRTALRSVGDVPNAAAKSSGNGGATVAAAVTAAMATSAASPNPAHAQALAALARLNAVSLRPNLQRSAPNPSPKPATPPLSAATSPLPPNSAALGTAPKVASVGGTPLSGSGQNGALQPPPLSSPALFSLPPSTAASADRKISTEEEAAAFGMTKDEFLAQQNAYRSSQVAGWGSGLSPGFLAEADAFRRNLPPASEPDLYGDGSPGGFGGMADYRATQWMLGHAQQQNAPLMHLATPAPSLSAASPSATPTEIAEKAQQVAKLYEAISGKNELIKQCTSPMSIVQHSKPVEISNASEWVTAAYNSFKNRTAICQFGEFIIQKLKLKLSADLIRPDLSKIASEELEMLNQKMEGRATSYLIAAHSSGNLILVSEEDQRNKMDPAFIVGLKVIIMGYYCGPRHCVTAGGSYDDHELLKGVNEILKTLEQQQRLLKSASVKPSSK